MWDFAGRRDSGNRLCSSRHRRRNHTVQFSASGLRDLQVRARPTPPPLPRWSPVTCTTAKRPPGATEARNPLLPLALPVPGARPPVSPEMMLAALLLTLSCLGLHTLWQAQAVPILPLGLAPDTFDDAYVGCAEEMEKKAAALLKEEMARHALLRESWEAAQEAWEQKRRGLTLPPGFRSQHGIAVMVYTNSSNTLYWELNQALRTGGSSREFYMRHFPFKALHFYLTRALQLLQGSKGCTRGPGQVVFRGVSTLRFEPKRLGDAIRLGQFASSSLDEAVAHRFGNATFFSLRTCFGAPIQALSVFPKEREVLIPPHEVFLVTRFSQDGARSLVTLWSYNKTCSNFNCAYLGGEKRRGCASAPTGAARLTLQQGLLSALPEGPAHGPRGVPALRSWALESPMPAT